MAKKFGMSPQVAVCVALGTGLTTGAAYVINELARSTIRGVEGVIHGNSVDNGKQILTEKGSNDVQNPPPVVVNINNSRS